MVCYRGCEYKESTEFPTDYVVLSLVVESVYEVDEVCKEVSDKVIIVGDAQKGRKSSIFSRWHSISLY